MPRSAHRARIHHASICRIMPRYRLGTAGIPICGFAVRSCFPPFPIGAAGPISNRFRGLFGRFRRLSTPIAPNCRTFRDDRLSPSSRTPNRPIMPRCRRSRLDIDDHAPIHAPPFPPSERSARHFAEHRHDLRLHRLDVGFERSSTLRMSGDGTRRSGRREGRKPLGRRRRLGSGGSAPVPPRRWPYAAHTYIITSIRVARAGGPR